MLNSVDRFAFAPAEISISRSRWREPSRLVTSFKTGDIIPIYLDEVIPGESDQMRARHVARVSTPVYPVMDDLYLDTYFFYIPFRILWDHYERFTGVSQSAWDDSYTDYVPQIIPPSGGWSKYSLADYFGIPPLKSVGKHNALPFRAYYKVFNDWFRNTSTSDAVYEDKGDSDLQGVNSPTGANRHKGALLKASKLPDYFTTALPAPQRGAPIPIPIGSGEMPVKTRQYSYDTTGWYQMVMSDTFSGDPAPTGALEVVTGGKVSLDPYGTAGSLPLVPSNLFANLADASLGTINDLRLAFQLQRLAEASARGGNRYNEMLYAMYGVRISDARVQRAEYLGGSRTLLNMSDVLQTSETGATSPLGALAGYSLTIGKEAGFSGSFPEAGYILGVAVARNKNSYKQGMRKLWFKKERFEHYYPTLAHIGEQPIYKREIYVSGTATDSQVFGYQEAWAEYRYHPNMVTGGIRDIDAWTYSEKYTSAPTLSESWMNSDSVNVGRTLAVTTTNDQIIAEFGFDRVVRKPMPLYSVPGLIDHH